MSSATHIHHFTFQRPSSPLPADTHVRCPDRRAHTHTQNTLPGCVYTSLSFHHSSSLPPLSPALTPHSPSLSPFRAFVCPLPPSFHRLGPDLPLVLDHTIIPRQDSTKYPNMSAILLCGPTWVGAAPVQQLKFGIFLFLDTRVK